MTSAADKSSVVAATLAMIRQYAPHIILVLGAAALSAPTLRPLDSRYEFGPVNLDGIGLWWLGLALTGAGTIWLVGRERVRERLDLALITSQNSERRLRHAFEELVRHHLTELSDALQFYSSERISLFVRDGEALRLVGRKSRNPPFQEGRSRAWPFDLGCIGAAWTDGQAIETGLPDPIANRDEWIAEQRRRWGLTDQDAQSLKMKSRTYIAVRIDGPQPPERYLGVIIAESTSVAAASAGPHSPRLDPNQVIDAIKERSADLQAILIGLSE